MIPSILNSTEISSLHRLADSFAKETGRTRGEETNQNSSRNCGIAWLPLDQTHPELLSRIERAAVSVDSSGLWPQCLPEGVYVKGKTEIQYVGGEGGGRERREEGREEGERRGRGGREGGGRRGKREKKRKEEGDETTTKRQLVCQQPLDAKT